MKLFNTNNPIIQKLSRLGIFFFELSDVCLSKRIININEPRFDVSIIVCI